MVMKAQKKIYKSEGGVIMTANELAMLKEQIKAEIIKELQQNSKMKPAKPWEIVRNFILTRLEDYDTYERYQIITAISTIIRHTLKIRHIMHLSDEDIEKAKVIAESILNIMEKNRSDKNEGTSNF